VYQSRNGSRLVAGDGAPAWIEVEGATLCRARHVRVERVEGVVRLVLADLLASPERVLDEARRRAQLYTLGELPEEILGGQSKALAERRAVLEAKGRAAESKNVRAARFDNSTVVRDPPHPLGAIRGLIESAESADAEHFGVLLRAAIVEFSASNEEIEISGAAPLIAESSQSFPTTGQTSASISQQDL